MTAAKKLVCGIEEALLNEEAIDEALALPQVDIHPAKGMKVAGKVELLVERFKAVAEKDLADCNVCGATSHADLPRCPFCGKGEDPAAAAPASEPGDEVGDPPDADEEGGDPGDEGDGEERESTPAPSPTVAEHPTTGQPLVDKKAAKAARDAEKAAGKAAAKEARTAAKAAKRAPAQDATGASVTAIVEHAPDPVVAASVEQLDRDVQEVLRLNRGMCAGSWLLAQKVAEISESQRWKLRLDDKGKVRYRTFEDFAKQELQIGREYARDLQKIVVRWTRDVFEMVGPTKLRLVLQAPADQQDEVLNAIKEQGGAKPVREVAADVKERRRKAGMKNARGEKAKPKKPAEKGKITVAAILGKHTLRAYKKPEKRLAEGETTPRAKKLADRPYASLALANDVTMWIEQATDGEGQVVFKIDIRRNVED